MAKAKFERTKRQRRDITHTLTVLDMLTTLRT